MSEPVDDVVAAYLHGVELDSSFHQSMLGTVLRSALTTRRLLRFLPNWCGSGGIVSARNETVARFLQMEGAEWLWWIDSDMGFETDALDRLLEVADPVTRPMVGGLCFAQKGLQPDGFGGFRTHVVPAVYRWHRTEQGDGFAPWVDYPRDTLAEVEGTGSAFVLIHRSVFEAVAEKHGPRWYDRVPHETLGLVGEDLSFCLRVLDVGIPIHVHTGIRTTHRKPIWIGEDDYSHPDQEVEHGADDGQ